MDAREARRVRPGARATRSFRSSGTCRPTSGRWSRSGSPARATSCSTSSSPHGATARSTTSSCSATSTASSPPGSDTTGTSFVNAFSLLAEFGELDYARSVLDDEDAMRRIVEEVLRFGTPFPTKPLFVLDDATVRRPHRPEGSVLHIWFAAANRDEAVASGVEQSSRWTRSTRAAGRTATSRSAGVSTSASAATSRGSRRGSSSRRRCAGFPVSSSGHRPAVRPLRGDRRRGHRSALPFRPRSRRARRVAEHAVIRTP